MLTDGQDWEGKMNFKLILTSFSVFMFCACAQTVSAPEESSTEQKKEISSAEEEEKEEISQPNYPIDSAGNIIEPSLKTIIVSDDGSDEAKEFFYGQEKLDFLVQYKLANDSKEQAKEMEDTLQKGLDHFDIAAKSDKWFVPATIQKGNLYLVTAKTTRNQECMVKEQVDLIVEKLSVIKQTIAYYEQARAVFKKGIDKAGKKKLQDENCQILEEYFINTYFKECEAYMEMATIYRTHPLPDSAAVVNEYVHYEGASMEDAIEMTHEDLEAYREALSSKSDEAKEQAISACESGVLEAQEYNLENDQVEATKGLLWLLDPENLALQ